MTPEPILRVPLSEAEAHKASVPSRCDSCGGPLFRRGRMFSAAANGSIEMQGSPWRVGAGDDVDCEQMWDADNGCRLCGLDHWSTLEVLDAETVLSQRPFEDRYHVYQHANPEACNAPDTSVGFTSRALPYVDVGVTGEIRVFVSSWVAMREHLLASPARYDEDAYAIHGRCHAGFYDMQLARRARLGVAE